MTDAKEPAAIAALREVVHPTSVGTFPIVYADILQAWDTLTRERDELRTLVKDAINYMVSKVVACHGLKCRERNCESCCDEDDAKAFVFESREVIAALTAALTQGDA
jgi:hypothetical protein